MPGPDGFCRRTGARAAWLLTWRFDLGAARLLAAFVAAAAFRAIGFVFRAVECRAGAVGRAEAGRRDFARDPAARRGEAAD